MVPGVKHQKSEDKVINSEIRLYERFLYDTANCMKNSGSPYGFITMGSAMVFTAKAYISAGGISRRKATEDFYFLQEVVKTTSVKSIPEILVHPSARESGRVYLGTGFRMKQAKEGFDIKSLYYTDDAFLILKAWLDLGTNSWKMSFQIVLNKAVEIKTELRDFLIAENLSKIWEGLQHSSKNNQQFVKQFHRWFDGLKTHRLLKYFSRRP